MERETEQGKETKRHWGTDAVKAEKEDRQKKTEDGGEIEKGVRHCHKTGVEDKVSFIGRNCASHTFY